MPGPVEINHVAGPARPGNIQYRVLSALALDGLDGFHARVRTTRSRCAVPWLLVRGA